MERPLWDRIQEIYYAAISMAPAERSAFVERACAQDPQLVREVKSLLDADKSSDSFLQSPIFELGLKMIANGHSNGTDNVDDPSRDDLIGETIDRCYLVEKRLGQGGIGKVYLARDLCLHNRPVVIKILSDASLQNSYLVQKFRHEVEALSRIDDHPNIVGVLDAGEMSDGKPYIVMQYVSGLTLQSQIPNEGMNLKRAALILKQIGTALDYIHERGIFHRDLKPDNIVLQQLKGGTEFVKVVDFGIAKVKDSVVASSTVDNIAIGTLQYMSPEQLRVDDITAASDVYQMAVVAYEMVTGRRPFNALSAAQLLELQRKGVRAKPLDLRPDLPTHAQAIILRGLSFKRTARYQNAAEFGDGLARALMNEAIQPDGPTWLSTRFKLIGSLAVVVFLAVLIGVYIFIGKGRTGNTVLSPTPTPTPTPTAVLPTHSLLYWLTVRSGKVYQNSFPSTNQDTFESGDKFRLNIFCPEPGYVYVFNEGTPEPGGTSFTILYPTHAINDGSASVGKDQTVQTNWNTFSGPPGTENLWIVWSSLAVPELDSAKTEAFKHPDGGLTGETLDTVKKFLTTKDKEVNAKTSRDKATQKTTLRFSGDVLVKLVELKHR